LTDKLKDLLILVIALVIFIVGVAGLFLPVIPGLVLIAFSLFLLSTRFRFARRWMEAFEKKYPEIGKRIREWRNRW